MRLLQADQTVTRFSHRQPRRNRRHIQPLCSGRNRHHPRLCMELPAAPTLSHSLGPQFKPITFLAADQLGPDTARRAIGHSQRPEEVKIAQFKRAHLALRPHRLGSNLQIARPGDQRLPRLGAMPVQHPPIHPIGRGKHPVARPVKPRLIQHGRIHRHHRRRHPARAIGQSLGRHANPGPNPPVQRNHLSLAPGARFGKGVQILIRRHIIDLPRRPCHGRGRGEHHHQINRPIREQPVQHLRAMQLRGKDLLHLSRGFEHQRPIIHHPRRMDHRLHPAKARHPRRHRLHHILHVADIRRGDHHLAPQSLQPLQRQDAAANRIGGVMRGQIAAPGRALWQGAAGNQRDLRAKAADQIFGHGQANAAKAPGNQHMRPIRQGKARLGQGLRLNALLIAPRTAQRGHPFAGVLAQFLQHAGGQIRKVHPATPWGGGQFQIAQRHRHPRHFTRDHPHRPQKRRLLRIGQHLALHLRRPGGKGGQMDGSGQVFLGHGLGKEQQRIEALLQIAVQERRSGPEAFPPRDAPEMGNAGGRMAMGHQIADERIIALTAPLGGQHIILHLAAKGIPGPNTAHLMPSLAQGSSGGRPHPLIIQENQPVLPRRLGQIGGLEPRRDRLPMRLPTPLRHILKARRQDLYLARHRLARFNEIGFALKRIARQHHAVAPRAAPDLLPIHRHPTGPKPRNGAYMPGIIGHRLFRMAQRRNDLTRRHPIGLRKRRERPTGAHLHKHARACRHERRHAGLEIHGIAQMLHPILRVHRLRRRQFHPGRV